MSIDDPIVKIPTLAYTIDNRTKEIGGVIGVKGENRELSVDNARRRLERFREAARRKISIESI
jgi:hypothetical protein